MGQGSGKSSLKYSREGPQKAPRKPGIEGRVVSFEYRGGKYVSDQLAKSGRPLYAILYDNADDEYSVGRYYASEGLYDYASFSLGTAAKTEADAAAKFNAYMEKVQRPRKKGK